jgi:aminopeptidase-like protein
MTDFIQLTRELCRIPTSIVANGNEALFERLNAELPFQVFRYPSGSTHNGWEVPTEWRVEKAEIRRNGKVIYDGTQNVLGVAQYSQCFTGTVSLTELKQHLYFHPELPDAHVFHCSWLYKPWHHDWGFCPPERLMSELVDGEYEVELITSFEPGEMLIGEHHKKGRLDKTIVFQSNTCHPHMANDGFSGVAVFVRLLQWLAKQNTEYSYRLILCPEHVGTVFYLNDMEHEDIQNMHCGVFGEMMGTAGPFVVASSFEGDHLLDRAFRHVVRHSVTEHQFVGFRESVGNDETVWEAPGYEVPFVQVNRDNRLNGAELPYPEYHSNYDNVDLVKHDLLNEYFEVFKKVVMVLETNVTMQRRFNGLIALSNPKYDLYVNRWDPALESGDITNSAQKWGHLQDCIIRYFDGELTILDIAEKHDLDYFEIRDYVQMFADKGLVEFELREMERRSVTWADAPPQPETTVR